MEMLDSDLTKSLVRFIGSRIDPGVGLPLVRWIYDESPWRHSLLHPFELLFQEPGFERSEEMLRLCFDFSWTSQIDLVSFFKGLRYLSSASNFVLISEFIELEKRDGFPNKLDDHSLFDRSSRSSLV